MPVRERYGKWHVRFWVDGRPFCQPTDLAATERNKNAAMRIASELRKLVLEGRAHELRLEIIRFNEAADKFLKWAEGEHQVKEITVRHDLHALSKFFGYAIGHNWAKRNPVKGIEIPSDADSVRMYILNHAEEVSYFQTASSEFTITVKGVIHNHGPFQDLHDVGRLILLQGNRPEEIYNLQRADVDLEKAKLWVRKGKSRAARRELQLLPESGEILARRLSMPESP